MKKTEKTKEITFSAMMIAIFVILHFIFPANNRSIQGVLGTITPIPLAIYGVSSNFKSSIIVGAAASLSALLFFEPIMVISFVIPSAIFGIVLGLMLKTKLSWWKMISLVSLCVGFNIYEMYINYLLTGLNFIDINVQMIKMSVDTTKAYFDFIDEQILFDLNIVLLPLMIIVGGTLKTLVTCYSSKFIIERLSGKKVEHKELEYYTSSSIVIEVVVLSIFAVTLLIWMLLLTGVIKYLFVYSILLDVMLFVVFVYYGMIHRKITTNFRDKKVKYLIVSLVYMSMFLFIAPIAAIKKIVKHWRVS